MNFFNMKQKATTGTWMLPLLCVLLFACNKQPIGPKDPDPVDPSSYLPISDFRALYTGTGDVYVPTGTKKIRGVVISNNANEAAGNYRLQDLSGSGIYLYTVAGSPIYPQGSVLEVDAAGAGVLTIYNGDLELKNVPQNKVVVLQDAMTVTPRNTTIAQVNANLNAWASTLVKIDSVVITKLGSPNSAGQNYNIADATGTIVSFVRNTSGIDIPQGGATSITGYVSIYQSGTNPPVAQITIRTLSDVVNPGQGGGTGSTTITLGTSPYNINFDNLATGLPTGVTVYTGATASSVGTASSVSTSAQTSLWNKTAVGFKNFASATGLNMGSDSAAQVNSTNRALGVRQTSSTGFDPGAAFVFQITNTTGKNNLKMDFQLQSLDTSSVVTRLTIWTVDYAIGDAPTSFTAATVTGNTVTGNKVFSNTPISVTFPAAVNNQSQKVWIRVVALTPTTGSNNRPSTAIDDVKFTWN
jgi:hypothetical protein